MHTFQKLHSTFLATSIKHYLLFICMFVFIINSNANTSNYYHPNLETQYKVGNVKQIGRASILLPLWQKEDQLLYFNAIGMMDNKNNQEGNFGLGFRKILNNKDMILGIFGHYDRKSSPNNNLFHQGTIGLELFSERFEARLNGYIPINSEIKLGKRANFPYAEGTVKNLSIIHSNTDSFEKVLGGGDIELGLTNIGNLIDIYGGYYYFNAKGAKEITGPKLRGRIHITDWLRIGGDIQYDRERKLNYYAGIELVASLGGNNKNQSKLHQKMTQMPVRDLDVVIQKVDVEVDLSKEIATGIDNWKAFNLQIRANLKGNFIILSDLDAEEISTKIGLHTPIGDEENTFQGIVLGAGIDSAGNITPEVRKITNLQIVGDNKHVGLFGKTFNAYLGCLEIDHKPIIGERKNPKKSQIIGALAGAIEKTAIKRCYSIGDVTGNGLGTTGGLIGVAVESKVEDVSAKGSVVGGKGAVMSINSTGGLIGQLDMNSSLTKAHSEGDVRVGALNNTGGLIGWSKQSTIKDVYAIGKIFGGNGEIINHKNKQFSKTGGLIGILESSVLKEANFEGDVVGGNISDTGGLIGWDFNHSQIRNVYAKGKVTGGEGIIVDGYQYNSHTGGLIGYLIINNLEGAYFEGDVIGGELSDVGGLVGMVGEKSGDETKTPSVIKDVYANSNVFGGKGKSIDGTRYYSHTGGLVGRFSNGEVERAYTVGSVQGEDLSIVGGLVGMVDRGTIESAHSFSSVNSSEESGTVIAGDLIGKLKRRAGPTELYDVSYCHDKRTRNVNDIPIGVNKVKQAFPVIISKMRKNNEIKKTELFAPFLPGDTLWVMKGEYPTLRLSGKKEVPVAPEAQSSRSSATGYPVK